MFKPFAPQNSALMLVDGQVGTKLLVATAPMTQAA